MKNKVLNKWMVTMLVAGMLTGQPAAVFAEGEAADAGAVSSSSSAEAPAEADTAEPAPTVTPAPEPTPQADEGGSSSEAADPAPTVTPAPETPHPTATPAPAGTGTDAADKKEEKTDEADEETLVIRGLGDIGLDQPKRGSKPQTGVSRSHFGVSVKWFREDGKPASGFERGKIYRAEVVLAAEDGYRFDNRMGAPDGVSDLRLESSDRILKYTWSVKALDKAEKDKTPEEKEADAAMEAGIRAESNEELVKAQKIVEAPEIVTDFRFWTVARKYGFAAEEVSILEDQKDSARAVGTLSASGLCFVLQEGDDGWNYVESGRVRGFVRADQLLTGERASGLLKSYQTMALWRAAKQGQGFQGIEGVARLAREQVSWKENRAYTWLRATVGTTVVDKDFAIADQGAGIHEGQDESSGLVGDLPAGGLCFVLADKDRDWVYVESGDVRGFVRRDRLTLDAKERVAAEGEDSFALAGEKIKPKDNAALYYTLTSVRSAEPGGRVRESMMRFASQFIGNPYVWGGTSLTNGADCSGFVQAIYAQYGYSIPRVAENQAQYGTKIPVDQALPGDLIFYAENGYVFHVVMAAGDGTTIEAQSSATGIVRSQVMNNCAVWATRILDDSASEAVQASRVDEKNIEDSEIGDRIGRFAIEYRSGAESISDRATDARATGTPMTEGDTVGVDTSLIPAGTRIVIKGHVYTAVDWNGMVKGKKLVIYLNEKSDADSRKMESAVVYRTKK